jgi:serine/threonine-protein phosphatase 2B catalytic subunit
MDVFDSLPLAAVVANKYLAMHGGISPDLTHVDDINEINRFVEVPLNGAFCDLLWSDPMDDAQAVKGQFAKNEARDCSHYFGKKPVQKFLKHSKLLSVFRGH